MMWCSGHHRVEAVSVLDKVLGLMDDPDADEHGKIEQQELHERVQSIRSICDRAARIHAGSTGAESWDDRHIP
jgi:hypothetical protein